MCVCYTNLLFQFRKRHEVIFKWRELGTISCPNVQIMIPVSKDLNYVKPNDHSKLLPNHKLVPWPSNMI